MSVPATETPPPPRAQRRMGILQIGGGAAILLVILFSFRFDDQVAAWVEAVRQPGLKSVASWINRLGDWPPLAGLTMLSFLGAAVARSRRWMRLLALALLASLLASAVVNPVRIITGRSRPNAAVAPGWHGMKGKLLKGRAAYSSFPSGHAAIAFAMAAPLFIFAGRWGIIAVIAAAAIGFSQIYLNAHYLSDVLAGAAVGAGCGTSVCCWRGLERWLDFGLGMLERGLAPVGRGWAQLRANATAPRMSIDAGSLRGFGLYLLCALAAVAATLAIEKRLFPVGDVPEVAPKLKWLSQHADEYNAVLIGSSRIQHGIVPELFDQAMEENGISGIHSFNLGVDAMFLPELSFFFDAYWKLPHRNLKFVVIEAAQVRRRVPEVGAYSKRDLYWRDLRHTIQACEAVYTDPYSREPLLGKRSDLCLTHIGLMILNMTNLGRGAELLQAEMGGDSAVEEGNSNDANRMPLSKNRGYIPLPNVMSPDETSRYRQELAFVSNLKSRPAQPDAVAQRGLQRLAEVVEEAGAVPVFVIAPTTLPFTPPLPKPNGRAHPSILDYGDPNRFPELYLEENRRDAGHLNGKGAIIFTPVLARDIAAELAKRGGAR